MNHFGGIAKVHPWFSFFFVIACMGSVALPSTGSFVGEWLILIGSFQSAPIIAAIATLGVILGAVYMLWITFKVLFGPVKDMHQFSSKSPIRLRSYEVFQLFLLTVFMFVLGFASTPILDHTKATLLMIEKTALQKTPYQSQLMNTENGALVPIKTLNSNIAVQGEK